MPGDLFMIKLISIDLDGTLLDNKKNISALNLEAIKRCKEIGIRVVIATGRPINGVMPILKKLGLTSNDDYVITYNGAKVFNVGTKTDIFTSTIDGKVVKELYNEAKRLGVHYHSFRENEELITVDHNPYTDVEATINGIEDHIFDYSLINDNDRFIKTMFVDDSKKIDDSILNVNKKYKEELTMVRSSNIFLEFLNPNSSKGLALEVLAKHLNIDINDTMALGDAGNDLPMLLKAGIGVCMENSTPDIKNQVKYITDSNEDSGVGKAIFKYVFNK